MIDTHTTKTQFTTTLIAERPRLVRLCAFISGDPQAAEDLAQETLLEAWRSIERLDHPEHLVQWLNGIARNVCARWQRKQGRDMRFLIDADSASASLRHAQSVHDITVDLERHELAILLNRAMSLLKPELCSILLLHYLEGRSHAEIAESLHASEGSIAVRIHRGKLAFRQLLENELRSDAELYGIVPAHNLPNGWQTSRIWCPQCGQYRLHAYLRAAHGDFTLRCPGCSSEPGLEISNTIGHQGLLDGLTSYKSAYNRVIDWAYRYYRGALNHVETGLAPCWKCGRAVPILLQVPAHDTTIYSGLREQHGVYISCSCDGVTTHCSTTLRALALHLPEGRRFWHDHPRIRMVPIQEREIDGQAVFVTTFESVNDRAQFEVVSARDTHRVLQINGIPCAYNQIGS